MVFLSTLRQRCPSMNLNRLLKLNSQPGVMLKRHGGHDTMVIKPTNFNFKKSKDMWHLYTCVAIILYGPFIFYQNVFVGEATLIEIPEGYRPKHWEYYKHPVTRWIQKFHEDPQKNYEKFLHFLYEEDEIMKLRQLDKQVDRVMRKKRDYEAHYYQTVEVLANAIREDKEIADQYKYYKVDSLSSSGFPAVPVGPDSQITDEFPEMAGGAD